MPIVKDVFVAVFSKSISDIPDIAIPSLLANLPVVLYESGNNTRSLINQWFVKTGLTITPIINLGNVEAIKEMVGAGLGCALLPGTAIVN